MKKSWKSQVKPKKNMMNAGVIAAIGAVSLYQAEIMTIHRMSEIPEKFAEDIVKESGYLIIRNSKNKKTFRKGVKSCLTKQSIQPHSHPK